VNVPGADFPKQGREQDNCFEPNAQVYSHKRKNFNQKCRFSNQTRMFVFENVKSCGKSEKNLEKCIETVKSCIETVENIGLFFTYMRI
jgi:CMP-N-acetylneuraminic acid synthetase